MSKAPPSKTHTRHHEPGLKPFQEIPSSKVLSTNWSMASGRWPHMNDPKKDNQVYNFIETDTQPNGITSSTTLSIAGGNFFALSGLPDASALIAVFDQYRIVQVEVWIVPTGYQTSSLLKSVVDYDNVTTTATQAYFDGFQNCHTTTFQNGHYRRFTPHAAVAAYSGGFTSYMNVAAPWLDCASPNVQHFGIKVYCDPTSLGVINIDFVTRYHIQFRNKV